MSLIDDAKNLPNDDFVRGQKSWHSKLDEQMQAEVDEFIKQYWQGKFSKQFRTLRKAADWLAEQLDARCKLSVNHRTVQEYMRARRP